MSNQKAGQGSKGDDVLKHASVREQITRRLNRATCCYLAVDLCALRQAYRLIRFTKKREVQKVKAAISKAGWLQDSTITIYEDESHALKQNLQTVQALITELNLNPESDTLFRLNQYVEAHTAILNTMAVRKFIVIDGHHRFQALNQLNIEEHPSLLSPGVKKQATFRIPRVRLVDAKQIDVSEVATGLNYLTSTTVSDTFVDYVSEIRLLHEQWSTNVIPKLNDERKCVGEEPLNRNVVQAFAQWLVDMGITPWELSTAATYSRLVLKLAPKTVTWMLAYVQKDKAADEVVYCIIYLFDCMRMLNYKVVWV
jgi:hypothetical protein